MKKFIIIFILFNLVFLSYSAPITSFKTIIDYEKIETYDTETIIFNSIIDWSEQKIKVSAKTKIDFNNCTGEDIKNTYLALKSLALRRAAEVVETINIDSTYTINDIKKISKNFTEQINSFLTDVSIYEFNKNYKETGILECSLSITITGKTSLTKFIADNYIPYNFNFNFPDINLLFSKKLYAAEPTGIIIDARGLDINPALLPKINSESKKEVYNPKDIEKKILTEKGGAQYVVVGKKVDEKLILAEAKKQEFEALKRTGTNPVIIKAYKVDGKLKTDAIIKEKDAKLLQNSSAIKEGKVTIIVDSRVGGTIGKKIGDYDITILSLKR